MSLAGKVISSSSLLVAIKIFQRLVGLLSIVILARLLTPEDFAIVALVAIIVHFFDILSNAGSEQYIIQKEKVSSSDLNTAWTLDIGIKLAIWLTLLLGSDFLSIFFEQPDLRHALVVGSIVLVANALKNPGVFLMKQALDYKKIFWLSVIQRIGTFVIVIPIALATQSYWALIIGDVFSSLVFTTGSYLIHNHRPRISIQNLRVQWDFSKWLLFKGVIGYTRSQIDTLIVSKFFSPALLGQYYMARNIAMMPSTNLLSPAIEPLLAAFKTMKYDSKSLADKTELCLFATAVLSMPIFVFIWSFPQPIIDTLLGEQWRNSSELLSVLAILFFYFSFVQILEQSLIATGKTKVLFIYDCASLAFITVALLLVSQAVSIVDFGLIRGLLGLITMLALLFYVRQIFGIRVMRIFLLLAPLLLISLLAYLATTAINYFLVEYPPAILLQKLFVFSVTYLLCLHILFRYLLKSTPEVTKLYSYINFSPITKFIIRDENNRRKRS